MEYHVSANSLAKQEAAISIKEARIKFGITAKYEDSTPNPAELLLGSLGACILKSVERFSGFMQFDYSEAGISLKGMRAEKPPRMDTISYSLTIYTSDNNINVDLLKRNIEGFGTIFNTVKQSCELTGEIKLVNA